VTQSTGYLIHDFTDSQREIARLAQQAEVFAAEEEVALERLAFPRAGIVLDLGCGPGFVAERIQRNHPDLRLVGADVDPRMASLASPRIRRRVIANALHLPFKPESFDAIHSRFVLRHLPDPRGALVRMRDAVKRDGRVLVIDADDASLTISPEPATFRPAFEARTAGYLRRGANPHIGRTLVGLFHDAGFTDIRAHAFYLHTGMCPKPLMAEILSVWVIGMDEDLYPLEQSHQAIRDLEEWARDPHAFAMVGVFAVSGKKIGG
jgi:SAM-dependent methyltransferase